MEVNRSSSPAKAVLAEFSHDKKTSFRHLRSMKSGRYAAILGFIDFSDYRASMHVLSQKRLDVRVLRKVKNRATQVDTILHFLSR
jgi:hypothetical protein